MTNSIHTHRFTYPTVRENVDARPKLAPPPDRTDQVARRRQLVAASLNASARRD